jgi:hypothetical protein
MKANNKSARKQTKRVIALSVLCLIMVAAATGTAMAKNKKYGVFVGIGDYPGMKEDLANPVNDAKSIRNLMISKFRFLPSNTKLLLDSKATRDSILAAIKAFGRLAGESDVLVFHYSGHGTLFPDKWSQERDEKQMVEVDLGDEYRIPLDHYDSAIVPWDSAMKTSGKPWRNLILDDELYQVFSDVTRKGATVVFISDSCHSGTISKAPAVKFRFMAPEQALNVKDLSELEGGAPKDQVEIASREFDRKYVVLSAARDNEFAADSDASGKLPNGLFTWNLIRVIKAAPATMTYERMMQSVRTRVANGSDDTQHPQLELRFGTPDTRIFQPILKTR